MNSILQNLRVLNPQALTIEGQDSALIGICGKFGKSLAVYSQEKIVANLQEQGMDLVEATDHFNFDICMANIGEHTPIIIHR